MERTNVVFPDGWNLKDDYDPTRLYIRATDQQGHKTSIRVSIPPHYAGLYEQFIKDHPEPGYRSVPDFFRDAGC